MIDFGVGVIIGGLALSACWGLLWLVIGTIGAARGVCHLRVVLNSLVVGITPLLFGWAVWWMRAEAFSSGVAFFSGMCVIPLILSGMALRRASDGRPVGLHMVEGIRQLKDELLATHHECGDCGHDHGPDTAGGAP